MKKETYEVRRVGGFTMAVGLTWAQAKETAQAIADLFEGGQGYIYNEQTGKLEAIYHTTRREG